MDRIVAKFLGEYRRFGDTLIATVENEDNGTFRVKGDDEREEFEIGADYHFWGEWRDTRYGYQFHYSDFVQHSSATLEGMKIYLERMPGIGPVTAKALVDHYGENAIKALRRSPVDVSMELHRKGVTFPVVKTDQAAMALDAAIEDEDEQFKLIGIFAGKGFPRKLVKQVFRQFGIKSYDKVKKDPYCLLGFKGVGFGLADNLYLSLGYDPNAIERQAVCVWWRCRNDSDGHSWFSGRTLIEALNERIGCTSVRAREAIEAAKLAPEHRRLVSTQDADGVSWFTDLGKGSNEMGVCMYAAHVAMYDKNEWPKPIDLEVSLHQRLVLGRVLSGRLAVLAGGAGVGKTYVAARIIGALVARHGPEAVAVVAPTGKAAVRVTELLAEYGVIGRATTIHTALEVTSVGGGGFKFARDMLNPLEAKFVICDESSMLDTWLVLQLLKALRDDAHILFIGDTNQLPPVGAGAPLRDLIAGGASYGELRDILRNSGEIVKVCAAIRDCKEWTFSDSLDVVNGGNLKLIRRQPDDAAETILDVVSRVDPELWDPVWDVQVVCALNEKGPVSRKGLNAQLQAHLNEQNESDGRFWKEDKVVCLRNNTFSLDGSPNERVYVANGELGRVVSDSNKKAVIEFQTPLRRVVVPKNDRGASDIDLGYALSCHKVQGSEFPIVIVALDESPGARMVSDRGWLYTALSRAKYACICVGQERTAKAMAGRTKIKQRKTFLAERYTAELEQAREAYADTVTDSPEEEAPKGEGEPVPDRR